VPKGENAQLSEDEQKLALALIDQLTGDDFEAGAYRDEYRDRVLNFLDEKSKTSTTKPAAPPALQPGHVIDIIQALKDRMAVARPRTKRGAAPKRRKRTG
jgi:non-homologous end joining protein Ku